MLPSAVLLDQAKSLDVGDAATIAEQRRGTSRLYGGMPAFAHAEGNIMRCHEGSVLKEQPPLSKVDLR
jgi:hypothetical protein